jgi:ABC-2 type transport system permease protein
VTPGVGVPAATGPQDAGPQGAGHQQGAGHPAAGPQSPDDAGHVGGERSGGGRAGAPLPGAELGPRVRFLPALRAVYTAQLSRVRWSRMPLLFVATFQSVGIMLLLRGVVDSGSALTHQSVVAGSTVLVVAFVALNLLAQQLGQLRASRALDYYATLPVPPTAVVLGIAAAYASFTVPGAVVTAVGGALLYGLPLGGLWVLLLVLPLAGAALAGLGAVFGLLAPRPELATLAGQLGMSAVLFLGIVPPDRLPDPLVAVRAAAPSSYAVDALAAALAGRPDWGSVTVDLLVCAVTGTAALAAGAWAFRRSGGR